MKSILILDANAGRIAAFQKAVAMLGDGFELKVWKDAESMMAECQRFFPTAAVISLDYDLSPAPGATGISADGLNVARHLGDFEPVCPVFIHSSNSDRSWSMHNELRFAGWTVERIETAGSSWIESLWMPRVREFIVTHPNTWNAKLPADHAARLERMNGSLDGLSIGDALGEMLAYRAETAPARLTQDNLPASPWFHTDDTEMAISIVAVLKSHGYLHQDALARRFSRRFERDPDRGYGSMTRIQMREIAAGAKWQLTSANAFGGQGSMGNGGAMRAAPLGAYFADDPDRCAAEARASSVVTHTHAEGIAGTIAVAVAAAVAWRLRAASDRRSKFFDEVLRLTPESRVRRGILLGSQIPDGIPPDEVAKNLGNGSLVTAPDTVPFCLWAAARHHASFVDALATTIRVGGDCDTNAAIVGGIVALSAGRESIPAAWLEAREPVRV